VGSERLLAIVSSPSSASSGGGIALVALSLVFYGTYARFREQVCTLVCPYGRLQSVLLDSNSIVVAYDFRRGEPRSKLTKDADRSGMGDCIDCSTCVGVCPTGIDIRNGTQLECVNCAACIDVCNSVMSRLGLPPKLIRYASYNKIAKGQPLRFRGRIAAYTTVLALLVSTIIFLSSGRSDVEATILRTTGSLYQQLDDGSIRNVYTIKLLNKSSQRLDVGLRLGEADGGRLEIVGPPLRVEGYASVQSVFTIEIPLSGSISSTRIIVIEVTDGDKVLEHVRTTFNGPERQL